DDVRRGDALRLMGWRHADVSEHGPGPQLTNRFEQLVSVAHPGQDLDLAGVLEEPAGAFAHQEVVLGDDDGKSVRHGLAPRPEVSPARWCLHRAYWSRPAGRRVPRRGRPDRAG